MKNLFNYCLLAVAMFLTSCAGCNRVQPNYEGVLMTNYGRQGKSDFVKVTGTQGILGPGSELYQVPMFEQSADPEKVTLTAKDAGKFTVDPSYTYQAIANTGVDIIFNYKHVGIDDVFLDNVEKTVLNRIVVNTYREQARNYTTDSLMNNLNSFEAAVEKNLQREFEQKFFKLNQLTSGLTPPASMSDAIERRNAAIQETETVKNDVQTAKMRQEKAKIDAETGRIQTSGLTKEVLQQQWIEAIRNSKNRIIITDGRSPIIIQ